MNETGQERARRQHDRIRFETHAQLCDHPGDASIGAVTVERQIVDCLLEQGEIRRILEARADRLLVENPVRLRPRGAHRGSLAGVEDPELDAGLVGGQRHRAAEGVELLDEMPLPIPPIDGLHDICPSVSMLWVRSSVARPIRAEASAASVPA